MWEHRGCLESVQQDAILKDVVIWNAMILGHMKCGQGHKAQEPFQQLQQDGACPISVTFVAVLNACASVITIEEDRCAQE
jgi:hypothetical protein